MQKEIHTFVIDWTRHGIVSFAKDSKNEIEKEVSSYLKADEDFRAFIKSLLSDAIEEDEKALLLRTLDPSVVLTAEDVQQIQDLDFDDKKYSVGRIQSWGFEVHKTSDSGQVKFPGGKDQFKAAAKRLAKHLHQEGHSVSNAQALEFLSKALYSKPYNEVIETLI